MAKAFTSIYVDSIKPTGSRKEHPDPAMSGLYLVVQPSGAKSWAVRYRFNSKPAKLTLGQWPQMGVAEARTAATDAKEKVAQGIDPKPVPADPVVITEAPDTITALLAKYRAAHLDKLKSGQTARRELDRTLGATYGDRPVATITRGQMRDLLETVAKTAPVGANRTLAYARAFFNWAMENDYLESNPTTGIRKPAKEESRDRVLSKEEIKTLWNATAKVGFPFGPMAQILLLTGQRLGEVAKMTDDEIDGDLWSMAKNRTKNGRAHIVPLSNMAREILDTVPRVRVAGAPDWVFSTTGRTPVQGFDGAKASINAAMTTVLPHWTFHDLRRTCASGMAELGVAPVVIEAVLNHASGVRASVAGVYNRHDYATEKRAALDLWADHIKQLIS